MYNDKKVNEMRIRISLTIGHMKPYFDLTKICMYFRITPLCREKNYLSDDVSHICIALKMLTVRGELHYILNNPRTYEIRTSDWSKRVT